MESSNKGNGLPYFFLMYAAFTRAEEAGFRVGIQDPCIHKYLLNTFSVPETVQGTRISAMRISAVRRTHKASHSRGKVNHPTQIYEQDNSWEWKMLWTKLTRWCHRDRQLRMTVLAWILNGIFSEDVTFMIKHESWTT